MFCKFCGNQIDENGTFCPKCGQSTHAPVQSGVTPPQGVLSSTGISNYLIFSVISIICFCPITGIIALYYSVKVNEYLEKRQEEEAKKASKNALNWNIAGIVAAIVLALLTLVFAVMTVYSMRKSVSGE